MSTEQILSPEEQHAHDDEETVRLCQLTSWWDEADELRDCVGCGRPFWSPRGRRVWCTLNCYHRTYYHAHPDYRAAAIARSMAAYRQRRAAAA